MHPGWIKTDMGGAGATLAIPESIAGMLAVIESLSVDQTGKFYSFNGEELPW